ncbi:MAG TPA: hypothetical protein VMS17_04975 [Gemmataceae bacterium]|nr:hypothetical protein [Gemmataceae bacterium]
MATVAALPSDLRNRIGEVAQRVRLLRLLRGLGLLTLIMALGFGVALLADVVLVQAFSFDLPNAVRIGVLAAWGSVGFFVFFFGLFLPLTRRIDAAAIAALVEEQYPELAERLTTSVELAGAGDEFHGAPQLIERLMRDTEIRVSRLDFVPVVSTGAAALIGVAAVGALIVTFGPAFVWPGQYMDLAERFFHPWVTPTTYVIDGKPGQDFAARGRPFTLSAHVTQRRHVSLPVECTLVVAVNGKETRTPMTIGKDGACSAVITPTADFKYRVEAGPDSSPAYAIDVIPPVELAGNEITTKPPTYAEDTVEQGVAQGMVEAAVLQNGTMRFNATFNRPAKTAYLDWLPMTLSPDRMSGSVVLKADDPGKSKYQVVLVGDRGIETAYAGASLTVTVDQAPQVAKFAGLDERRALAQAASAIGASESMLGQGSLAAAGRLMSERKEVLPFDRFPVDFTARDDVAVAQAAVEYRVNHAADWVAEPIASNGYNSPQASGQALFSLAGKVKPGDVLEYRLRVTDNLPKEFGGPHVVYYPTEPLVLHVPSALEIAVWHDDISSRLEKIKEELKAEGRGVYKAKSESRDRAVLTKSQSDDVKQLKRDNTGAEKDLLDLADAAEATPFFKDLADLARDVAAKEMTNSGDFLDKAADAHNTPAQREEHFTNAETEVDKALKRLGDLAKLNDQLAAKEAAQEQLAKLAEQEKALAEKTAEANSKEQTDQLKQQQQQTADELQKLAQDNPALQQALSDARAQEARDLANQSQQLAQQQRDLAQAQAETERQQNQARLADLARKQQELADKAATLADQTKEQAQIAKTNPLKPDDAQKAADNLKQGDADQALKNQDQSAKELDRIAEDLAKAIDLAKDPREAARQLARLEEGLKQRATEEAKKQNDPKPLAERMKPIQQEQKAVADAINRLSVPPANQAAQQDKKQAQEQASHIDEAVKQNNAWWAASLMDQTKQALEKLANDLPSLDQRKAEALKQLAELRKQQDEIAQKAEQAAEQAHNADPKDPKGKDQIAQLMNEAARKQADVAERLAKMDAPDQEARQQRTADAMNNALKDLMDARKADVPASQEDAKRQLARLEQAIRGEKPADEKAADLAKRQADLAAEAAKAAADPKATPEQKDALNKQQAQVAQEAKILDAPEAPQRKAEAADAAQKATDAAKADATSPEAQKQMQQAAKKLDALAKQMNGQESEAARAQRLADRQAEAAAQAQRDGQQPTPATQQKEQQVAEEARQLHAGADAQAEKQRAEDALQRAKNAAPQDQAKAQRDAADALHDLADKMAGRDDSAAKANELAREQRDLAQHAANPDANKDKPDALKKDADKQADLAHQLDRLDAKNAAQAQKDAAQKMADAAQALQQAQKPADAADQLAKAADAADKLARDLAQQQAANPQNPQQNPAQAQKPTDSPRQAAQQLAQQQRQLANQTQQAQNQQNQKPGEAGKQAMQDALQKVAQQQNELNQQASQLPAGQQQKALEQAREAMNQAQQALERNDGEQAKQRQNQAADALQQLANQLPQKADTAQRPRSDDAQTLNPTGLPNRQQADQARDLAKQQRELEDELRKAQDASRADAARPQENPLGDLAKLQRQVADQAAQAERQAAQNQGEKSDADRLAQQAQQAAQQAADQLQNGALQQAQQAGQQAAEQMRQLAQQLQRLPGDANAPDQAQNAQRLAQKQDQINRQLQAQANNAAAQRAQQDAQQQNLQRETNQLTQDVNRLAQEASRANQGQQAEQARQAAAQSHQAENAMQQARQQGNQGNQAGANQQQQQAAQALQQAAQQLAQAGQEAGQQAANQAGQQGQQPGQQAGNQPGQQAGRQPGNRQGQAVQQAQNAMQQAQGQLNQGQQQGAQQSMSQAAQALAQAAQAAQESGQGQGQDSGQPDPNAPPGEKGGRFSANGVKPNGTPDLSMFPKDVQQKYAGKPWGELPGELRTKIVQQMRVKYGDDYARMIKLYFEQAADTRDKK